MCELDGFVSILDEAGSALVYSSYVGGRGPFDAPTAVAVDASQNVYVSGRTDSDDFPTTAGAFDRSLGAIDAFVMKIGASGALVYSTYIGGSGFDAASSHAVDVAGNAYVIGRTSSPNFPATPDAIDAGLGPDHPRGADTDAFVTKLAADGALVYGEATIDGGQEVFYRIIVTDRGEPGVGRDTYSILLSNGYDSVDQVLDRGHVEIRRK